MAGSITVNGGVEVDNRKIFDKAPRLSDDDVISKAQNISTPSNPLGVRTIAGASGGHI
jgi:hypothetical protein